MEIKFNCNEFEYLKRIYSETAIHEETMEIMVSDGLPDVDKIIDTGGVVLLRSKSTESGQGEIAGEAEICVLYLPDGSNSVCKLEVILPFVHKTENREINDETIVTAELSIKKVYAKPVNPRKVIVKAEILIKSSLYIKEKLCVPYEISDKNSCEIFKDSLKLKCITDIKEKVFVISDNFNISSSKSVPDEILEYSVNIVPGECKSVGTKLIFKGTATLSVLYKSRDDGKVDICNFETVFSQVAELDNIISASDFKVAFAVSGVYLTCENDISEKGATLEAEIHIVAQCHSISEISCDYIADIYDPVYEMECERNDVLIENLIGKTGKKEEFKHQLRTTYPVKNVVFSEVSIGKCDIKKTESATLIKTNAEIKVIYFDDNNILRCDTGKCEIKTEIQLDTDSNCDFSNIKISDIYAAIIGEGVEVRFTADFEADIIVGTHIDTITNATLDENKKFDMSKIPSMTLYRIKDNDTLWDISKRFRTSQNLITASNPEAAELKANSLIVIPKIV